jgi:hypothetical protein
MRSLGKSRLASGGKTAQTAAGKQYGNGCNAKMGPARGLQSSGID